MSRHRVCVEVATVWTSPDAPREVDEPAVRDVPDSAAWCARLDPEARMGLHGRTLTQLLEGEPVDIREARADGWVRVTAPWQPAPQHQGGYPGWVRAAHLGDQTITAEPTAPAHPLAPDPLFVLEEARRLLGVRYLWGGMSPYGLDCSGLVHYAYRQAGIAVPRDASAQQQAALPVLAEDAAPGDLYFFSRDRGPASHVGFVSGRLTMLHAPESGGRGMIEDVALTPQRRVDLVGAGRFRTGA